MMRNETFFIVGDISHSITIVTVWLNQQSFEAYIFAIVSQGQLSRKHRDSVLFD
jgi:hypothetical protein